MALTRIFKSGNSQEVRIPAELAYEDMRAEFSISRHGYFKDILEILKTLPKAPEAETREPIGMPDRAWD